MNSYYKGNRVRVRFRFRDEDDQLVDPTKVQFTFKLNEDGTPTTYEYSVDSEVVREETGVYYVLIRVTQVGIYITRAVGLDADDNEDMAEERRFEGISNFA